MIGAAFLTTYTVKRMCADGKYVNGYYVGGSMKTFTIKASVQPLAGKELLALSEGDRQKDSLRLYGETLLKLGDEGTLKASDLVMIDGKVYQVRTIENWNRNLTIRHFKAICVLDNRNDEPNMVVP